MRNKISVLMPVYNCESYIYDSIASILDQSFKNIELIIIDDCSTDLSFEIISQFSDERIILLRNEKNLGVASSLNACIKRASGDYLARMDADDIAEKHRLNTQLNYLLVNKLDMVGSYITTFGEIRSTVLKNPVSNEDVKFFMNFLNPIAHPSILGKKEAFQNLYNPKYFRVEDYEFWARLISLNFKIGNVPLSLLNYRISSSQISNNNFIELKKQSLEVVSIYSSFYFSKEYFLEFKKTNFGYSKNNIKFLLNYVSNNKKSISLGPLFIDLNFLLFKRSFDILDFLKFNFLLSQNGLFKEIIHFYKNLFFSFKFNFLTKIKNYFF
ncbi:glycosyltransferase family 2 protein [Polynucleobacter sphagniphilus]|uniref:Glycosyltransferase involved in cell wall biosynthesis n=1 Tax=Polynucleobacter sphagniphilus TaxID=1743169 RepID=A0AA43MCI2_9BURK|nr:glycosyltransferase family 2 protein [Polynucleobacter sphagniphilus]MDH6504712.1 glycosyltransferase involved in cell wall biosynthesis [Polynucleobacter sphagniphilus]MDH6513446.1 glycosyltransferase involved in cell wall biosynthesis [Polynucleobacter sphagniphilus]